jgi:hypothetical protein
MAKKKRNRGKGKGIFGVTTRMLMLAAAGLLMVTYGSMLVNPAKAWGFSLLGLLFVPLSLVNLVLLLWAVKRLSRSFVIPLLALLPSLFFIGRYVQIPSDDPVPAKNPTLKIVSYNVGRFAFHENESPGAGRRQ